MNYLKVVGETARNLRRSISSSSSRSSSSNSEERLLRVAVLGASRVGKTSLIKQLTEGKYSPKYEETIEDLHKYTSEKDIDLNVDILDTSGSGEYTCFRRKAMKNYDAFLMVFSLQDYSSFKAMREMIDELLELRKATSGSVPILIVGNKSDRRERFSSKEKIDDTIREYGLNYTECSATSRDDARRVFEKLIDMSESDDLFRGSSGYLGGVHDGSVFVRSSSLVGGEVFVDWIRLY